MTAIALDRMLNRRLSLRLGLSSLSRFILGVPLFGKLIGANVLIFAAAAIALWPGLYHLTAGELIVGALAVLSACVANLLLVRLALRPIDNLERVAERVADGEFTARVEGSPIADARIGSLASTVNALLDALAAERKRITELGREVIRTQDAERSRISREIHDSIAQSLAAVRFQMTAASDTTRDFALRNKLTAMRVMLGRSIDDLRTISEILSPRVAEDLGLPAALEALAAQTIERSGIHVEVIIGSGVSHIPPNVAATLFRVAQEGLRNVELHSHATAATVTVVVRNGVTRLDLADNGRGFDTSVLKTQPKKTGLSTLSDRVTLAGGTMMVHSHAAQGTHVAVELHGHAAAA